MFCVFLRFPISLPPMRSSWSRTPNFGAKPRWWLCPPLLLPLSRIWRPLWVQWALTTTALLRPTPPSAVLGCSLGLSLSKTWWLPPAPLLLRPLMRPHPLLLRRTSTRRSRLSLLPSHRPSLREWRHPFPWPRWRYPWHRWPCPWPSLYLASLWATLPPRWYRIPSQVKAWGSRPCLTEYMLNPSVRL